ncbi:helix-turn-helix domain-containing protein [Capsulimonas corticalis]|uniref:helix-turn-helix domain-containing protein n=1 Tax=Capsulimonas corticalis TaxID=2219043 RepID=UPI001402742E|nr:helix-turn-helix domain-containing protein [Capsulimonas corticalis]
MSNLTAHAQLGIPEYVGMISGHYDVSGGYGTRRDHGARDWLLVATIDGRGRFGFAGGERIAQAGELILLKPGAPHDYSCVAAGRWEFLWTHFQPRAFWYDLLSWPEFAPGMMSLSLTEPVMRQKIAAQFWEAHRLESGRLRRREAFAMTALEMLLLLCDTQNPLTQQPALDPRIQAALDCIFSRLSDKLSLGDLAGVAGLSPSRFAHLFREQMGAPPLEFLDLRRLDRAKRLLDRSSVSVGAVAEEIGFDPLYFSRWFKRHTGLGPRAYRRRLGGSF